VNEHEPTPAGPRQHALADPRRDRGGHTGVDRATAGLEYPRARCGRQWMPGSDRAFHEGRVKPCPHPTNLKFRCTSTEVEGQDVNSTLDHIRGRVGRRGFAAAALALIALVAAVATPQILGRRVAAALDILGNAHAPWLWLAAIGFTVSVVTASAAWRSSIAVCGGRLSLTDACARYGAGSLANTVAPLRAGDILRIALFSRALPVRQRLRTTGGAFAAMAAARGLVMGSLVVVGAAAGIVPLWPVLVAAALVAAGVGVAVLARRHRSHLLDAFRAMGDDPRAAFRLTAWLSLQLAGRLAAAIAVGAALGIRHPIAAAVVVILALDVAGLVPLTPGNIGLAQGAIAIALHARGTPTSSALAAGIAFHAIETAVGLMFGIASLVWLAPYPSPAARRVALLAGAASWALGIAGAFSATVLVPLV
jgi:uncharacterized membrane protein YbhN (UPF0104 family)